MVQVSFKEEGVWGVHIPSILHYSDLRKRGGGIFPRGGDVKCVIPTNEVAWRGGVRGSLIGLIRVRGTA